MFAALFLSLQQCPGELFLPVSLPAAVGTGQAEDLVTFYHYVCVHLCAFITSLSVSHFHLLVRRSIAPSADLEQLVDFKTKLSNISHSSPLHVLPYNKILR